MKTTEIKWNPKASGPQIHKLTNHTPFHNLFLVELREQYSQEYQL